MYGLLTRTWWLVLARGGTAIAFGATLLAWSKLPVASFGLAFGAFAVVDGTLGAVGTIGSARRVAPALLVEGAAGIASGIVVLGWPALTTATLLVLVATWAAVRGVVELWAAWGLHRQCPREVTLAAAAVAVLVACAVLAAQPSAASAAVERVTGAAVVTAGALLVLLAARLWTWLRASHRIADMVAGPTVQPGRQRAV